MICVWFKTYMTNRDKWKVTENQSPWSKQGKEGIHEVQFNKLEIRKIESCIIVRLMITPFLFASSTFPDIISEFMSGAVVVVTVW